MAIDSIIQKKANDIRTKVYGIEVREDLASGLETMSSQVVDNSEKQRVLEGKQNNVETQFQQVIDETTGKDIVSAPEIIAARGAHPNLSQRLQLTDQRLSETVRTSNGRLVKILFGVIRNELGTWEYIEDATHNKLNLSSLSLSGNALRVAYDFIGSKVGTFSIEPDEFMASQGIVAGASVGTGHADVFFYGDVQLSAQGDGTIPYIPEHLKKIISVSKKTDGTGITVSHPTINSGLTDFPMVSQMQDAGGARTDGFRVAWSPSTIDILHYKDFSGTIAYVDGKWVVNTDNIHKPTVSFSNGVLTITHYVDNAPDANLGIVNVEAYTDSDIRAQVTSYSKQSFLVKLVDSSGNKVTNPGVGTRIMYHRPIKVQSLMPDYMRFLIRRGKVQIPAKDLITGPTGNFWVQGMMNI